MIETPGGDLLFHAMTVHDGMGLIRGKNARRQSPVVAGDKRDHDVEASNDMG